MSVVKCGGEHTIYTLDVSGLLRPFVFLYGVYGKGSV